jgi:aspartate-semialdehyde dehydrogenase
MRVGQPAQGAALNAVQIAECLINSKLITAKKKAA